MPAATAPRDAGAGGTGGGLEAGAPAVARRLLDCGNGAPGHVCLVFRDRRSAVASIVGTARAGGVYVTFDPADPEERLRFMLGDAAPIAMSRQAALPSNVRDLATGNPDPRFLPDLAPVLRRLDAAQLLYGDALNDRELLAIARAQFDDDGVPPGQVAIMSGASGVKSAVISMRSPRGRTPMPVDLRFAARSITGTGSMCARRYAS